MVSHKHLNSADVAKKRRNYTTPSQDGGDPDSACSWARGMLGGLRWKSQVVYTAVSHFLILILVLLLSSRGSWRGLLFLLPLPVFPHVRCDGAADLTALLVLPKVLHELPVWTHQVHDDGVINNVVVVLVLGPLAVVDSVGSGHLVYLGPGSCQPNQLRGELFDVGSHGLGCISVRVNRNEEGGQAREGLDTVYLIHHLYHLLYLIRADVRTMCEAEVDEDPLAEEVFALGGPIVVVGQGEWPA